MLLAKSIIREYYRQNTAFYFLIAFLAFGLMRFQEHRELSFVLMQNPVLLFLVGLVWLLHAIKSSLFFNQQLKLPDYQLFQDFVLRKPTGIWKELFILQAGLNLPFLGYSLFMLYIGVYNGFISGLVIIVGINLFLIALPAVLYYHRLLRFNTYPKLSLVNFRIPFFKSSRYYFIRHLVHQKTLLFFSTKVFGILLLIGGAMLFPTDDYDFRLLGLCVFFTGLGQVTSGRAFLDFMNRYLQFERNMPLALSRIFLNLLILSFFLMLPEYVILVYHWHGLVNSWHLWSSLVYWVSIQLFWLCFQYLKYDFLERNLSKLFLLGVLHFLLIMFKFPLAAFATVFFGLSWIVFSRNYYTFEIDVKE